MTNSDTPSDRLGDFLRSKRYTNKWFADKIGVTPGMISTVINGRSPVTAHLYARLIELFPELNIDWLAHGRGAMIYAATAPEIENTTLPDTFFNRNFPLLLREFNTDVDNLSSIIQESPIYLTDLVNGTRGPSLRLLLRLRDVWGVDLNALLFADLTLPGAMEEFTAKSADNLNIVQQLEALAKRVEALEKGTQDKETQEEKKQEKTPKIDKH